MRPLSDALDLALKNRQRGVISKDSSFLCGNSLSVAVSLELNSLLSQGNWLSMGWTINDSFVTEEEVDPRDTGSPARLHLIDSVTDCLSPDTKGVVGSDFPSRVLLPLGIALVELVVSQSLANLRRHGDVSMTEHAKDLQTAKQHLEKCLSSGVYDNARYLSGVSPRLRTSSAISTIKGFRPRYWTA